MRFALLGSDDATLRIAEWIRQSDDHSVNAIYQPGEHVQQISQNFPSAEINDGWEALLLNKDIDAVVISSQPRGTLAIEQRADQLRKLLQESVPTLMVHPVCESIVAFELEMIRSDTNCPLVAWVPNKYHSAFHAFCEVISTAPESIGAVEQIVVNRTAKQRDRESVLHLLAVDSVLITELIGDAKSVSASGATGDDNTNVSNLSVTFAGESAAGARWSVEPAADFTGVQVSAVGERGKIGLTLSDDMSDASLTVNGEPVPTDDWSFDSVLNDAVRRLEQRIADEEVQSDLSRSFHALEIVDAVTQSCRRRRTIELLAEQPTEEDTFKAMMAAGGCGMLMWTLVLVILGPLLFLTGSTFLRILWYVLLIGPISVFLGLQLLRLVFDNNESS